MTPSRDVATRDDRQITRDDIHAKLNELASPLDDGVQQAKSVGVAVAVAIGVVFVIGAFMAGRRKGRRRSTVVEIRRI